MQFLTLAATTLLASLAAGSPVERNQARADYPYPDVHLRFIGAADTGYNLTVKADGSSYTLYDPLSITYISSDGSAVTNCEAFGVNGSTTFIYGTNTVPVGPPQGQRAVTCY